MSPRGFRVLALTGLTVLFLLIGAGPASAAEGDISGIQVSPDASMRFTFTAADLPPNASLNPGSVRVTLSNQQVQSSATPIAEAQGPKPRQVVLLTMDTSGSMADSIGAARAAARSFVNSVKDPDVEIGLVSFDDRPAIVQRATKDRVAINRAINGLRVNPTGGTALYDAVLASIPLTGTKGTRNILLLSDGRDTDSAPDSLQKALRQLTAQRPDLQLDAVALGEGANTAALHGLARAGGGQVQAASGADELGRRFQAAGAALTRRLLVTAQIPPDVAAKRRVLLYAEAKAGNTLVTARDTRLVNVSIAAPSPSAAPSPTPTVSPSPIPLAIEETPAFVNRTTMLVGLAVLFAGLAGALAVAFIAAGRVETKSSMVRRRLSIYTLSGRTPVKQEVTTTALGQNAVARSVVEFAGKVVARRDVEAMLSHRLDAAGVPLKAAEWSLIHLGTAIGFALLLLVLSEGGLMPALVGLLIGLALPYLYLNIKESRRVSGFLSQLPDTLQLISGSLSAGYSLPQAVDTVVREGQAPMATELNRALVDARLGVPIEDALEGVGNRMRSRDFLWVVMAIRIQREVGGNLAEVLSTVSATLRERERLRRQVSVLSAEGRLSAWILGLLPLAFCTYLILVRPSYLQPLVDTPLGWFMIGTGVLLLTVGVLWMRKAVKVEV